MTQEQLAEYLNVSNRSVSRWETGSNLPDLSMLITLAEYYDIAVGEIIDGKRKSEKMNEDVNDTLEKVVSYNEMRNLKSMRKGIMTMSIVFLIMVQISLWKELSPAPLISMICAYSGAALISKAREGKDKSDFIIGSILWIIMLVSTITFILK
jgi:transcriptional regulator with XRE-family HTH domain